MQMWIHRAKLLAPLLAAAYLGFYVYGVILSVFSPMEMIGFSVIALLCAAGIVAATIAGGHLTAGLPQTDPRVRRIRDERERRGF